MRKLIIGIFCFLLWQGGMAADVTNVANLKHSITTQAESIQRVQQNLTELQTQLQKISADFNDFKQQMTTRIDVIAASNNSTENKIATLSQSLNAADQKMLALQKAQAVSQQGLLNRVSQTLESWGEYVNFEVALIIFGLVIVLLIGWWWHHHHGKKKKLLPESPSSTENTQGEYDLMNSAEGIPAKLNLARAYIEMSNKSEAYNVLQEVLQQGNEAQKQEAKGLLEKCA